MKRPSLLLLLLLLLLSGTGACENESSEPANLPMMSTRLHIRICSDTFTATLSDNPTSAAFVARLPLTVAMSELNSNEKYYDFATGLPTNAINPGTIQAGDLMMYGSETLVLFYKSFVTSYRYTRLGGIDNPAGLAAALGAGNATVTFEL